MRRKWNRLVCLAVLTAFGCGETAIHQSKDARGYSETDEWGGAPYAVRERQIVETVHLRMDKADVLSLKGIPTTVAVTVAGNIQWVYEDEGRTVYEFNSDGRVVSKSWSARN